MAAQLGLEMRLWLRGEAPGSHPGPRGFESRRPLSQCVVSLFRGRLMAGRVSLKHSVEVQILPPEPLLRFVDCTEVKAARSSSDVPR